MTAPQTKDQSTKYAWAPQPGPQHALIKCPAEEIFFGGARGGGKTDAVVGKCALRALHYGKGENQIIFRRELPATDDLVERAHSVFTALGARWNGQDRIWRWPNGARTRVRPLMRVDDADKYQGQNVTFACVEEAGQYPDPKPIERIHAILRSATDIPTQLVLTGNPGGAGQHWLRHRYIDPCPAGNKILRRQVTDDISIRYCYIPSRLADNAYLGKDYVARLHMVGSKELVKAWLHGDWNAVEGAFFDNWSVEHIVRPFTIPEHWMRFRSADWGSAKPFSVGWWAVASEDYWTGNEWIPRGAMVRYREWYGASKDSSGNTVPNQGLKMNAELVGKGIRDREEGEHIEYGVMDPAAFTKDGGPSIVDRMGVFFRRADNKRVGAKGALGGWDQMRSRLDGEDFGEPMGWRPMIFCFDTCRDSIRTIPMLQHDDTRPEDLDTGMEDHAADEWRYACMSRPYIKSAPGDPEKPRDAYGFDDDDEDTWKTA